METEQSVFSYWKEQFDYFVVDHPDPRVSNWPLMGVPWPALAISLLYVIGSVWVGPQLFKKRKASHPRVWLILYNICQIGINVWLLLQVIRSGWFTGYNFQCQPLDHSRDPKAMLMATAVWWFYISRYMYFLDTLFLLVQKKFDQITFMHMVNHGLNPLACWYVAKYLPGGHVTFIALINSSVNILLYTCYLVSGFSSSPRTGTSWWKSYARDVIKIQFAVIFFHQLQLFITSCDYPKFPLYWTITYSLIWLYGQRDYIAQKWDENPTRQKVVDWLDRMIPGNTLENKSILERLAELIPCCNLHEIIEDMNREQEAENESRNKKD